MHICVPVSERESTMAETIEVSDIWPRIARWNRNKLDNRRLDQIRFNISMARSQLEMRTTTSIIWQPYMGTSYQNDLDVEIAFELSRHRTILQYCMQVRIHFFLNSLNVNVLNQINDVGCMVPW